jgi:predicted MFS family arabinose efflux permease
MLEAMALAVPLGAVASRGELARRRVATGAVLGGLVVAAFEGTVVTPAMPTIVHQLGGMSAYAWVFSAFLVASTVSVLASGKVADAFGRKPVFVGGMVLFLLGSVLCGSATTFGSLVAFRVVQGLGAGALQPVAMTISADIYTLEERARIQGIFTGAWGAANVLGPVIGGWIVVHASWPWVFWVNVPVGVLSVVLLLVSYRDPARDVAASLRALARPFPAEVLRPPAVPAGLVASLFAGGILAACSAYVPLWMTLRSNGDALAAGAALVPLLVGWAIGSSFGVRILVSRGMRTSVGGGFTIAMLGAVGLAMGVAEGLPTWFALGSLAVLGLGLGPAASTSLVGPQSCVSWQHRGAVTSAIYATRMLGGSIVVAALGPLGGTPEGSALARFAGVAILALGGAFTAARMAPRVLSANAEVSEPCPAGAHAAGEPPEPAPTS